MKVKITSVGNAVGILIPEEALKKLNADKGDTLYLVEDTRGFTLTSRQDFESQMEAAEKVLKKYRNTLHELIQ